MTVNNSHRDAGPRKSPSTVGPRVVGGVRVPKGKVELGWTNSCGVVRTFGRERTREPFHGNTTTPRDTPLSSQRWVGPQFRYPRPAPFDYLRHRYSFPSTSKRLGSTGESGREPKERPLPVVVRRGRVFGQGTTLRSGSKSPESNCLSWCRYDCPRPIRTRRTGEGFPLVGSTSGYGCPTFPLPLTTAPFITLRASKHGFPITGVSRREVRKSW